MKNLRPRQPHQKPSKMKTKLVFLGEHTTGKSSLIHALSSLYTGAPPPPAQEEQKKDMRYWRTNFEGTKADFTYPQADLDLHLEEIIGSRGRMSNYHAMTKAILAADCIVYCVPSDAKDLWRLNGIRRAMMAAQKGGNRRVKLVVAATLCDKGGKLGEEQLAFLADYQLGAPVYVSAKTSQGLEELMGAVAQALQEGPSCVDLAEAHEARKVAAAAAEEEKKKEKEKEKEGDQLKAQGGIVAAPTKLKSQAAPVA